MTFLSQQRPLLGEYRIDGTGPHGQRGPVWPVQSQNIQRECQNAGLSDDPWTCEETMKASPTREGARGILIIGDLIPSLITHNLEIYDSCLCPVIPQMCLWAEKKGSDSEISQSLILFFNLPGGVAFEQCLNFKDYKRSNRLLNSLIHHTFNQQC